MKIYKTQKEIKKDIKDYVLTVDGDVKFECSFSIEASIIINDGNIKARNIDARDINANSINARDINAWDINARDINARDIKARDINAWDINARDINARDIKARDINARDIFYYALCLSYNSIKCSSWKAERSKHQEPICIDGKLIIKEESEDVDIIVDGKKIKISRKSAKALNLIK